MKSTLWLKNKLFQRISCIIFTDGGMRLLASLLKEMQDWVFAEVSQNTIRRIAHKLFVHLHSLDLSFHLATKKGELAKAIDRGSR